MQTTFRPINTVWHLMLGLFSCQSPEPLAFSMNGWMSSNRLHLNPLKTQCIWLGTRQQLAKLDLVSLSHEFPTFVFSTSVRNLGVILGQELSFAEQISSLTCSCFYQLRQLRVVSHSLTPSFSTAT